MVFQRGTWVAGSILLAVVIGSTAMVEAWNANANANSNANTKINGKAGQQKRREFLSLFARTTTGAAIIGVSTGTLLAPGSTSAIQATTTTTTTPWKSGSIYTPPRGSLVGRVVLITGASSGLGLESMKRLAAAGATVVGTARSTSKSEATIRQLKEYLKQRTIQNPNIYCLELDLDTLQSVRSFPKRYEKALSGRKIDVLINNAGVAAIPKREITNDGFEKTFQSNHLGPFVLTACLFPLLNRDANADTRVINVASTAHNLAGLTDGNKQAGLDLNNLNGELAYNADGWGAYGNSKLESILFSRELQKRADRAGLQWLTVNSLHPGHVGTDIWRNTYVASSHTTRSFSLQSLASKVFYRSTLSTEEGANTQVFLAAASSGATQKGVYYDEHGSIPKLKAFARDETKAQLLWDISEELSGKTFAVR